jgi:hypothetical protein
MNSFFLSLIRVDRKRTSKPKHKAAGYFSFKKRGIDLYLVTNQLVPFSVNRFKQGCFLSLNRMNKQPTIQFIKHVEGFPQETKIKILSGQKEIIELENIIPPRNQINLIQRYSCFLLR